MKEIKTIEELLISKNQLDRIYLGCLSLHLWRSLHEKSACANPLYPDFEKREIRKGVIRVPDIEVITMPNGTEIVKSALGKGTSLFDRPGALGESNWTYFEIPAGTQIPVGLIITKDVYSKRFNATHYSISANYDMPKQNFIRLLDELAKNAEANKRRVSHG